MRMRFLLVAIAAAIAVCCGMPAEVPTPKPESKDSPLKLELHDSPLAVKFVNTGKEPIRILRPLDGSSWCWIMPHYKLTVIDANDREIGPAPRCGLFGFPYTDTKWPDDYLVIIRPGDSYIHRLQHNHNIREAGTYRLRFEYNFTPKNVRTPGGPYPANLWRGSAMSNTIETKLK